MKIRFLAVILLLFCISAQAKRYAYLRFTTEDGLAGNNVYFILQDRDGFIWIATETGLSRFDGTYFKNYTQNEGLGHNDIPSLLLDKKNRLWVNPFGSRFSYIYKGKVQNIQNNALLAMLPERISQSNNVAMMENKKGQLLLSYDDKIMYIDELDHMQLIKKSNLLPQAFDPVQNIGGLMFPADELFYGMPLGFTESRMLSVLPHNWLAIYKSKERTQFFHNFQLRSTIGLKNETIITIRPYCKDTCLINTSNGCYLYNMNAGKITDTILTGYKVNFSFLDNEGGIWLSADGLFYFPPARIITLKPEQGAPHFAQISSINSNNHEVYVGSKNALLWKLEQNNHYRLIPITFPSVHHQYIHQSEGNVQLSPESGILYALLRRRGVDDIFLPPKSISYKADTVTCAYFNGMIESFTWSGSYKISFNVGMRPTCALKAGKGYYIGTLTGLYYIADTGKIDPEKAIVKERITALSYAGKQDMLWVGTSNQGLYCIQNNKVIRHFNKANGLSNDVCKCLYNDGNKIYIGTLDGLNIIDPESPFSIKTYYRLDGLAANNISCIYADTGKILVGTSEGLNMIPQDRPAAARPCTIQLTEVMVSGRPQPLDTAYISLSPSDNNIQFTYSGISFSSMGRIKYYYRLKGLDDQWHQTDQNYLKYPSLPHGKYTLELYAVNRFNKKSRILSYDFTIERYWWQYAGIQLAGITLLLTLASSVLYYRLKLKKRKEHEALKLKNKILELEQLALRAQMNPHFIFNSLNSFYQYVINQDMAGASEFMSNFSKLIRLLFETTTLTEIVLNKELEFLTAYLSLEKIKLRNKFDFHIQIAPGIKPEYILIPTFIIQPFIENSIKHGFNGLNSKRGMIYLMINFADNGIIISIDDNGVGRAQAMERTSGNKLHHSQGIALTSERIELYNKIHHTDVRFVYTDKYDDTHLPAGTRVDIFINVHKNLNDEGNTTG